MLRLRVDVDKPYGNHSLLRKVLSKLIEETGVAPIRVRHLDYLNEFLDFLKENKISAIFFFRNCTAPGRELVQRLLAEGHKIGFHAENTSSFEAFSGELSTFRKKVPWSKVSFFSKHGSGMKKLGRFHYPIYEPQKYREWGLAVKAEFHSGNDIFDGSIHHDNSQIFWVEPDYRHPNGTMESYVEHAKARCGVVLCHPENFVRSNTVKNEFKKLIDIASSSDVDWAKED